MAMTQEQIMARYYQANHRPWEDSLGMVRLAPHTYYVGDNWVGVLLIETEDGLVMIDSGIKGQMWMIFESVRKLGYDPEKDIKLCLLSHAHADHCSGMALLKAYSNPVIYMSELEKDWPRDPVQLGRIPASVDSVEPFEADRFYVYDTPIEHGGFSFLPVYTPGHTPGTTSFFYEDGGYRVGFHGGMGMNTLFDNCFSCREDALRERGIYRTHMEKLLDIPVDITVTNHGSNIRLSQRVGADRMDFQPFVDRHFWKAHLVSKLEKLSQMESESIYK